MRLIARELSLFGRFLRVQTRRLPVISVCDGCEGQFISVVRSSISIVNRVMYNESSSIMKITQNSLTRQKILMGFNK
jgi:hypothetical protein